MGTKEARRGAASSREPGKFRGRRPVFFLSIEDWDAMSEGEREAFVTATRRKAGMLAHLADEEPDRFVH